MKLKDVMIKNFKVNFRSYISCFLYNSFSIMSFFMFTTLLYNRDVQTVKEYSEALRDSLYIPVYGIAIFSVIFIAYSQNAFIMGRGKEFGLYRFFGMTRSKILKYILAENLVIQGLSLAIGLVSGTLFSPVFFLGIIRLLDFRNIGFHYCIENYTLTAIVFSVIFLVVNIISVMALLRLEIINMLKMNRIGETNPVRHPVFGAAGPVLLTAAFTIWSRSPMGPESFKYLAGSFLLFLVSSYLILSQAGNLAALVTRVSKKLYYKNMLFTAEAGHRVNNLKKIMFLITMLITISTLFITISLSEMMETNKRVEEYFKHHLYYSEILGRNALSKDDIGSLAASFENKVELHEELPFILMSIGIGNTSYSGMVTSDEEYNRVLDSSINVPEGEVYRIVTGGGVVEQSHAEITLGFMTVDKSGGHLVNDPYKGEYDKKLKASVYNDGNGIQCYILNHGDYEKIKKAADPVVSGKEHIINFKDWRKSEKTVGNIEQSLREHNNRGSEDNILKDGSMVESITKPRSKISYYLLLRNRYSMNNFICIFIGVFFFFMACNILYLKYFSGREEMRAKFLKLFRIGIKDYEIKRMVSRELKFIFFVPLVLGFTAGFLYNYVMALKQIDKIGVFLEASAYVSAVYLILNVFHYYLTKHKVLKYLYKSLGFE